MRSPTRRRRDYAQLKAQYDEAVQAGHAKEGRRSPGWASS